MSQAVKMPALGESVTEGTVSQWLKSVGDTVEADEPLLEVSTDKVDSEIPAPTSGTILQILVQEDETVDVGTDLCLIGDPSEAHHDPSGDKHDSSKESVNVEHPEEAGVPEGMENETADDVKKHAQSQTSTAPSSPESEAATEVKMPALGESVTEGTVSQWLKSVGDTVEADEPLLEVSTDKVDSEIPAPTSGTILQILVQEDETVDVGTVLARIGDKSQAQSGVSDNSSQGSVAPSSSSTDSSEKSDSQLPGANIPSSFSEQGDKKVVQWAYPQVHTGYPGTMTPPGQKIPSAPQPPVVPSMPSSAPAQAHKDNSSQPVSAPTSVSAQGTYVTPIIRKLAKEKGVNLNNLVGSGVGGRIRREDVLAAAKKQDEVLSSRSCEPKKDTNSAKTSHGHVEEVSSLRGQTEKMSRLRQTIAKRMMESLQTSAQLTTVVEVDVTRIASLRARAKNTFAAREGTKLTYLPFFVKAATEALKSHPKINATIKDTSVIYHDHEDIGIAVDTERGLMVPVIRNCGDLTIAGIAKQINDLAARTRSMKVKPEELSGSTFTITNTGSGGALFDTPILNTPEVAILGLGTIVKRPMVIKDADGNDTIAIRSMVYLALSYDHRLVDGGDAARYLMSVKKRLEEGDFEAEV